MKQIEAVGSSINEAIEAGLKELGVTLEEVEHEVLGTKGLFRKKYVVRLTVKESAAPAQKSAPAGDHRPASAATANKPAAGLNNKPAVGPDEGNKAAGVPAKKAMEKKGGSLRPAPAKPIAKAEPHEPREPKKISEAQQQLARDYMNKLLELMHISATVEIDVSHGSVDINVVTEDTAVIGHRGEVLDAMQILCKRAVEEGEDKYVQVNVDSHNYRMQREQSLVALAERMANKCVRTGKKVVLEPMNNTHRKIIHAALSGNDKVITRSEGREPNRRVVILPKRD